MQVISKNSEMALIKKRNIRGSVSAYFLKFY